MPRRKDTSNYAYQVKYPTSDTFTKYLVMDLDISEYMGLALVKLAIYGARFQCLCQYIMLF